MTISVWGWGTTTISTWGWGTVYPEYISVMLAAFIESHAYTCVLTRDYIEVLVRETGEIALRIKPEEIPLRVRGELLSRIVDGDVLARSKGWPWQEDPCLDD